VADPYRITEDWREGYEAGYDAGLRAARRDIGPDMGMQTAMTAQTILSKPRKKMKRSSWHKYMKNKKNQIKFKRGAKKGLLDMKTMSRNYRRSKK